MPMNDFQRDMFILRQNEWDSYKEKLKVTQGDLAGSRRDSGSHPPPA